MKSIVLVLAALVTLALAAPAFATTSAAVIPTQAKGMMAAGAFQKSHTYKLAYYNATAAFDATTAQYTATNEVSGTNYTAGGYTLSGLAYGTSGTTYWMDFADNVQSSVTFTAPSTTVMIYDSSLANSSCTASAVPWPCCTGSTTGTCTNAAVYVGPITSVQPSAGTLTATFPAPDATNAIVRVQ